MHKSFLFAFFFFFTLSFLFAQQEVKISGIVLEQETGYPLEYATISFFNIVEKKITTGGITDLDGKFEITVPTGTYNIIVEYISYTTKTKY